MFCTKLKYLCKRMNQPLKVTIIIHGSALKESSKEFTLIYVIFIIIILIGVLNQGANSANIWMCACVWGVIVLSI